MRRFWKTRRLKQNILTNSMQSWYYLTIGVRVFLATKQLHWITVEKLCHIKDFWLCATFCLPIYAWSRVANEMFIFWKWNLITLNRNCIDFWYSVVSEAFRINISFKICSLPTAYSSSRTSRSTLRGSFINRKAMNLAGTNQEIYNCMSEIPNYLQGWNKLRRTSWLNTAIISLP